MSGDWERNRAYTVESLERAGWKDGELQWLWRTTIRPYNSDEVVLAICDALTREGCIAWSGDGTSCVEQMVRFQYQRAEAAEERVADLEKRLSDLHGSCCTGQARDVDEQAEQLEGLRKEGKIYEVGLHDGAGCWYLGVQLSPNYHDFLADSSEFTGDLGVRWGDHVLVQRVERDS